MLIVLIVLLVVCVLWIAFKIARAVQKAIDRENKNEQAEKHVKWLGSIHGLWGALVSGLAALKYVYNAWKTAPADSYEKFGWGMVLAGVCVLALWLAAKAVDKKLNGANVTPLEGQEPWRRELARKYSEEDIGKRRA